MHGANYVSKHANVKQTATAQREVREHIFIQRVATEVKTKIVLYESLGAVVTLAQCRCATRLSCVNRLTCVYTFPASGNL